MLNGSPIKAQKNHEKGPIMVILSKKNKFKIFYLKKGE